MSEFSCLNVWTRSKDHEDCHSATMTVPYVVAMAKSETVASGREEDAQKVAFVWERMMVETSLVYDGRSSSEVRDGVVM